MSFCTVDINKYCQCQPDEGISCINVVHLTDEIERLRAQIAEGRELLIEARGYSDLAMTNKFLRPDGVDEVIVRIDAYLAKTATVSSPS